MLCSFVFGTTLILAAAPAAARQGLLSIDASAAEDRRPDVAYDATLDVYVVVWERHFGPADVDVHGQVLAGDGSLLREFALDPGPEALSEVHVAGIEAADQFLIATRTGATPGTVVGRTLDVSLTPPAFTLGAPVELLSDCANFELAGDPTATPPLRYCIAGENRLAGLGSIDARLIDTEGVPGPKIVLADDEEAYQPRLSKARGGPGGGAKHWGLLVERGFGAPQHLEALHVEPGPAYGPSVVVSATSGDRVSAISSTQDAASGAPVRVALWERAQGPRTELRARVVRGTSVGPVTVVGASPTTSFEHGWVDSDGSTFVVVHVERANLAQQGALVASSYVIEGDALVLTERATLASADAPRSAARIASEHSHGGAPGRFLALWQRGLAPAGDIEGALYDTPGPGVPYCIGAPNSVGAGAAIRASGSISLALNAFGLSVAGCPPNQTGIFYLGTSPIRLPFGEGFRCIGGGTRRILPALTIDGSGAAQVALDFDEPYADLIEPGTPATLYQFWYRDPAGGPAAFNLSNALRVEHTP